MSGLHAWMTDAWIGSCRIDASTERSLRYDLWMYDEYLIGRKRPFHETSYIDVLGYLFWLEAEHAPSVTYHALGTLKRFYAWCEEEGHHPNVAKKAIVEDLSRISGTRTPVTPSQVNELLEACITTRENALLALVCLAMTKPSELRSVVVRDVRLLDPSPRIVTRGGVVYLTDQCARILEEYLAERDGDGFEPLFRSESIRSKGKPLSLRSMREIIQEVFNRTDIPGTPGRYSLGASAVVIAARSGVDPIILMEMAVRYGKTLSGKRSLQRERGLSDDGDWAS